jgi:hypothetical protein
MKESVKEIVLPRRPPINPTPCINGGGDCGACVVAGVLNITVEQAYEYHVSGNYYGGDPIPKISSWNQNSMRNTLTMLVNDLGGYRETPRLLEHVVDDVPIWPFAFPFQGLGIPYGLAGHRQFDGWVNYVRAMLTGQYYGITTVYNNGFKKTTDDAMFGETDHWITIVGWRYAFVPTEDEERKKISRGHYQQEVLIANSARSSPREEWIDVGEFLKSWGGFGVIWAKPL